MLQWRSKGVLWGCYGGVMGGYGGGPFRAAKLRLYQKIWKVKKYFDEGGKILGRGYMAKNREGPKKGRQKILGYETKMSRGGKFKIRPGRQTS